MARAVYSTLFIAAQGVDILAGYAVPAGYRAIVRDVDYVFNGTPADTACRIGEPGTGTWIAYHLQLDPYEEFHWVGHQVFNEGSTFNAVSEGPTPVSARVSGYLLTLP